jgi:hypothetical protein
MLRSFGSALASGSQRAAWEALKKTAPVAKSRPDRKRKPKGRGLPLPSPQAASSSAIRVLPMNLKLVDERGEWRVVSPHTAAGKEMPVRVELVGQPGVTEVRSWGAHERVAVRRGG